MSSERHRSPKPAFLDIGGNSSLSRLRRALAPKGTLIITGGETDGRWLGGTDRQIRALLLSPFVGQKLGTFVSSENHLDMIVLKELIEAGKVTPVIDRTYPLSEVPATPTRAPRRVLVPSSGRSSGSAGSGCRRPTRS